jgi:hypothetical protein
MRSGVGEFIGIFFKKIITSWKRITSWKGYLPVIDLSPLKSGGIAFRR